VHRVIKALLSGRTYGLVPPGASAVQASSRKGPARSRPCDRRGGLAGPRHLEIAGAHTSTCERRADEASRDVEAWLKCRFMREHLGEEYAGTVSSVAGFGLFVALDALHVEGLVHITELGGEYWRFDEVRQELRGERSGMRYAVGSRVRVQVSRVDLDARKIDFRDGDRRRGAAAGGARARCAPGGGREDRSRGTGRGAPGRPPGEGRHLGGPARGGQDRCGQEGPGGRRHRAPQAFQALRPA
jgi:ribonuclease R